jgi:hypothetical protein
VLFEALCGATLPTVRHERNVPGRRAGVPIHRLNST